MLLPATVTQEGATMMLYGAVAFGAFLLGFLLASLLCASGHADRESQAVLHPDA